MRGRELLSFWDKAHEMGLTREELARYLGISRAALDARLWRAKHAIEAGKDPVEFVAPVVELGTPIRLIGDAITVGDIHVPTVDYEFAQLPIVVGAKLGIKRLIIGGDLLNMDAFSTFDEIIALPTWQDEKKAASRLISAWQEWFDEIYIIMGNHDYRLLKWSKAKFTEQDLFELLSISGNVTITRWGHLVVDTEQGEWRITHSKHYSVNPLVVANELAQKFCQHIVQHHEHHLGITWDRFGRHVVVNNGGLFDESKLAYAILSDTKRPTMKNGFMAIKDGFPYLFGKPPFTNWSEVLRS